MRAGAHPPERWQLDDGARVKRRLNGHHKLRGSHRELSARNGGERGNPQGDGECHRERVERAPASRWRRDGL